MSPCAMLLTCRIPLCAGISLALTGCFSTSAHTNGATGTSDGGNTGSAGSGSSAGSKSGSSAGSKSGSSAGANSGSAAGANSGTSAGANSGTSAGASGTSAGAGSGSSAGSSGAVADAEADVAIPPHVVGSCDSLPDAGSWDQITPPGVSLDTSLNTPAGTNYGVGSFVLDPNNSGTVYLGTSAQGFYKTTDCGATWTHIDTGTNSSAIDTGRQWTMQIDPTDSNVLYTNAGYGTGGAFKSTDGGKDWTQIIPANLLTQFGPDVARIQMDPAPSMHNHLLLTPHFICADGSSCILETMDGGMTWNLAENAPPAEEGAGLSMIDSTNWLWQTQSGIWLTTDGGKSWTQVNSTYVSDGFYQAPNGALFVGAGTPLTSTDNGATWMNLGSWPAVTALTGDATRIFTSQSYCTAFADTPFQPYTSIPLNNLNAPTTLPSPMMKVGGRYIAYDSDHHILYSDNCLEGFWRGVIE
jgi:hypothetical protein